MTRAAATLLLLACCAARAAAEPGITAAPFLNAPVGARAAAMGQAFTAVRGGPESLNYNPGAPAFTERYSVAASYMRGFGDTSHGFIAATLPVGRFVLTPGFMYFDGGNMDLNLSDGTKGSVSTENDTAVYASAALRAGKRLGLGATAKKVRLELAETASASAMVYDLGALYSAGGGLTLGASWMNLGGGFKFEQKSDPSPAVKRLGAAWLVELNPPNLLDSGADLAYCAALFTADWVSHYKDKGYYQAGAELNMEMPSGIKASLRAGFLFDRTSEGMTFGFGIAEKNWSLDLSADAVKEMDSRQRAGLSYYF